jgi:hypothetical protein
MRPERTIDEERVLNRLAPILEKYGIESAFLNQDITDRPDILYSHSNQLLGVEVTRLAYEAYCKWLNTPPETPYSRTAEVELNIPKMLAKVMEKKKHKYQEYKSYRHLNECWLILHNNLFELHDNAPSEGVPNIAWLEEQSQLTLQELECPYDRVLFNLEHPNLWYSLFDKNVHIDRRTVVSRWPTMLMHETAIQTDQSQSEVRLGDITIDEPYFK